jgi:MscS family membrane protein
MPYHRGRERLCRDESATTLCRAIAEGLRVVVGILRPGWRACICVVLVAFAATMSPSRAEGDLAGADLELIAPPDLSSPRATLEALRTNFDRAYDIFGKAYHQYRNDPGFFASPEVSEQMRIANLLLRRAMSTIDLSQVPLVNRDKTGMETVLLLGEILHRLPAIDPATVPDAAAVAAVGLTAWTLPYTDLDIVRIEEGPDAGRFVFSADTVELAPEVYETVRPYGDRVATGTDLYRFYALGPGDLLPPKWYPLIERLPDWAQRRFFLGHALWQWVGIGLTLLVVFGAWWFVVRLLTRRHADEGHAAGQGFVSRIAPPLLLACAALLARSVIIHQISVSGRILSLASIVLDAIAYLAAAWVAYLVCAQIGGRIATSSGLARASIDASLIRVAGRVVGIAAAIAVLFVGATAVGLPLYGVIAGLGVGGLALGLAARPTLENLIGGLTLYADRPVRVGDVCKFGGEFGIVEEIGLRSTRIRAMDRTLITVPNADFSDMVLTNFSRRDQSLLDTTIVLRLETTTTAQIETILAGITELLLGNPEVNPEWMRVHFQAIGPYGFGIGVRAYIRTTEIGAFLEVQEGILFGIMKVIEAAGARIATLPLAGSSGQANGEEAAAPKVRTSPVRE